MDNNKSTDEKLTVGTLASMLAIAATAISTSYLLLHKIYGIKLVRIANKVPDNNFIDNLAFRDTVIVFILSIIMTYLAIILTILIKSRHGYCKKQLNKYVYRSIILMLLFSSLILFKFIPVSLLVILMPIIHLANPSTLTATAFYFLLNTLFITLLFGAYTG